MSWQADADAFGELARSGDWRLGLLVARSVEPGIGQGARNLASHDARLRRVSLRDFASRAGIGGMTVARYLRAWERAADRGLVPPAAELAPDAEPTLPDRAAWDGPGGVFGAEAERELVRAADRAAVEAGEPATARHELATRLGVSPNAVQTARREPDHVMPEVTAGTDGRVLAAKLGPRKGRRLVAAIRAEQAAADALAAVRRIKLRDLDVEAYFAVAAVVGAVRKLEHEHNERRADGETDLGPFVLELTTSARAFGGLEG